MGSYKIPRSEVRSVFMFQLSGLSSKPQFFTCLRLLSAGLNVYAMSSLDLTAFAGEKD